MHTEGRQIDELEGSGQGHKGAVGATFYGLKADGLVEWNAPGEECEVRAGEE